MKGREGKTHLMSSSMYCCCTWVISSNVGFSHFSTWIGCPTTETGVVKHCTGIEADKSTHRQLLFAVGKALDPNYLSNKNVKS